MSSLAVGPFALSLERLLFLVAVVVALLAGWLAGRRRRVSVEPVITTMLLWGMLGARLGFVLLYLEDYRAQPWSLIDIRDGGFLPAAGLVAAAVAGAWQGWRHPRVRRPLGAAVVAAALAWATMAGALHLMRASQPTLPDLAFATPEGDSLALAHFSGRPVVINLWATWCPPCRREMPVLAAAQQRERDVAFVFVNQGEAAADVQAFLEKERLSLRHVLLDPDLRLSRAIGLQGMPTTLFFDADGKLVESHLGELSPATLRRGLESLSLESRSTRTSKSR